jgi:hypothetical protein
MISESVFIVQRFIRSFPSLANLPVQVCAPLR